MTLSIKLNRHHTLIFMPGVNMARSS